MACAASRSLALEEVSDLFVWLVEVVRDFVAKVGVATEEGGWRPDARAAQPGCHAKELRAQVSLNGKLADQR
jgi:hypothetical protein